MGEGAWVSTFHKGEEFAKKKSKIKCACFFQTLLIHWSKHQGEERSFPKRVCLVHRPRAVQERQVHQPSFESAATGHSEPKHTLGACSQKLGISSVTDFLALNVHSVYISRHYGHAFFHPCDRKRKDSAGADPSSHLCAESSDPVTPSLLGNSHQGICSKQVVPELAPSLPEPRDYPLTLSRRQPMHWTCGISLHRGMAMCQAQSRMCLAVVPAALTEQQPRRLTDPPRRKPRRAWPPAPGCVDQGGYKRPETHTTPARSWGASVQP